MEAIFHEKQEGQLCAQHCLNALLQGPFYTAVDLGTLAQQLDDEERNQFQEGSQEMTDFLRQASHNMDDAGFFSLQVISRAISVWGLELVSFNSSDPRAINAREHPVNQSAFICNYREHWFTIRRIADQWFNLNSLLTGPELISPTFLSMFLAQLQQEGYSIHIVFGELPHCPAEDILRVTPAVQTVPPRLLNESSSPSSSDRPPIVSASELATQQPLTTDHMRQALATTSIGGGIDEDAELELALQMSRALSDQEQQQIQQPQAEVDPTTIESEEDQIQRAIHMSLTKEPWEEEELKKAIELSMKSEPELRKEEEEAGAGISRKKNEASEATSSYPAKKTKKMTPALNTTSSPLSKPTATTATSTTSAVMTTRAIKSTTTTVTRPTATTTSSIATKAHSQPKTRIGKSAAAPSTLTTSPPVKASSSSSSSTSPSSSSTSPMSPTESQGRRLGGGLSGRGSSTPDPEEIRRRRLAFLDKQQKKNE